jgi:hypothetical protein
MSVNYSDGILRGSLSKEGSTGTVELQAGEDEKNFTLVGTVNFDMG